MSKPEILNILVDNAIGNVASTTSPIVKWGYYDLNNEQMSYTLKVGSTPGNNDILDTGEIFTDFNEHVITPVGYDSVLKSGIRYYITLSVSSVAFEYSTEYRTIFVTDGIYWDSHVDNSVGWTVEFYFRVNSDIKGSLEDLSSISSPESNLPHHNVDMKDGYRLSSLEMYVDRVVLKGGQSSTLYIDNRDFHLYRVTGQGDDLKLYVDGFLKLNANGTNNISTDVSEIKFGSSTNEMPMSSTWCSILIDLNGVIEPSDLPIDFDVSSFFFNKEEIVDTSFDFNSRDKVFIGTNPIDVNLPGRVYSLYKNSKVVKRDARPFLSFESMNIVLDSRGNKWANTRNNLFKISGEFGGEFDKEYTFQEESDLSEFFRADNCQSECADFGNLLRINTKNEPSDSFWYYETVKNINSDWYYNVDNDKGWTVESDVRIADDGNSIDESAGLVINDGVNEETIYIFKNRVRLKNANIEAFYDFFTETVSLRIVGVKNNIRVYVKTDKWELLIDGKGAFGGYSQILSDSDSISSSSYSNKNIISVWHSNKAGSWNIFTNNFNGIKWESERQLLFADGDSLNPDVFVDRYDNTHVVYQNNSFGNNEIFYAFYNGSGNIKPIRITDSSMDSIDPKVTVTDNGDIHIVWVDNRNFNYEVYYAKFDKNSDQWLSSSFGYEDEKISSFGSSFDATGLSVTTSSDSTYVSWSDDRNAVDSVYLASNFGTGWNEEILVSNILFKASSPNISSGEYGSVNIVWEDYRFGTSDIYYNSFNNISLMLEERISNTLGNSYLPFVGEYSNDNLYICWIDDSNNDNTILLGTINDGVINSSGGGGSDLVMSNVNTSSVLNISNADISLNDSGYLFYIGNDGSNNTSYSYRIDFNELLSVNIDESLKVSNLHPGKMLKFGDISENDRTISEWSLLKYSLNGVIDGLIVESKHIDGIVDIHIDLEDNLYVLSDNGLNIYKLFFSDDNFITNSTFVIRASSSPVGLKMIRTFSNGSMVAITNNGLYYAHSMESNLVDEDIPWMRIDVQYALGMFNTIYVDSDDVLWIGFSSGAVYISRDDLSLNNILSESNSEEIIQDRFITSFSASENFLWISHSNGVSRYSKNIGNEYLITASDGLIDKTIDKVLSISDSEFWMVSRDGLSFWDGSNVSIYRNLTRTNNINDFLLYDGGIWIANDEGVEFFNPIDENSFLISEADGFSVVDSFEDYKIYKYNPFDIYDVGQRVINNLDYKMVSINGIIIDDDEYIIDAINGLIIFREPLNSNSEVSLTCYTNSYLAYDFADPKLVLGVNGGISRVLELVNDSDGNTIVILGSNGDSIAYILGESEEERAIYPFDSIILDLTPPVGTMTIEDQITASEVLLKIKADDNVSGVDKMVLSNFQNFTIDGVNPSPELDYSESALWDLGGTSSSGALSHQFDQGDGNIMFSFSSFNSDINDGNGGFQDNLYAGTSDGAFLYKFDLSLRNWSIVQSFLGSEISDSVISEEKLFICTSNPGALYSSIDGVNFDLDYSFADPEVKSLLLGTDGNIYIGTGNQGRLYSRNQQGDVSLMFDLGDVVIHDMTEYAGYIYLATGETGRIYRLGVSTGVIEIIYDDNDTDILSINTSQDFNSDSLTVYAGTDPSGKIMRLIRSRRIFSKSFQSTFSSCRRFYSVENTGLTYACIDNTVFQFNKNNWKGIYIDSDNQVMDVQYFENQLYILTDKEIKFLNTSADKSVYIKFIDFAGNETVLFTDEGELKPQTKEVLDENGEIIEVPADEILWDSISSDELAGFSLQNRLIIYDETGSIIKSIVGETPYLTAGRVDEEKAVYTSEQFDGTNNLVSWDYIAFSASTPSDTEVIIQIRTFDRIDETDDSEWSEPVPSGLDISSLNGRFIQFRATLISRVRGITPILDNVTITAKTTFGVHYFTTNFVLPSNLQSGLLSANVVKPEATEIVFGIGTDSSTNWNNYQVIPTEKLFVIDDRHKGQNLRVGVRFLSSSSQVPELHEFALIFSTEDGELVKLNL
jgi:hypothetical protein